MEFSDVELNEGGATWINEIKSKSEKNSFQSSFQGFSLFEEIKRKLNTKFDTENASHEALLLRFRNSINEEPLEALISEQWKKLGFQSKDPSRDVRGSGTLGLQNLIYFCERFPKEAKQIISFQGFPLFFALLCSSLLFLPKSPKLTKKV